MTLPTITTPTFTTTIPSTGQEISYRPFLVKEEKILLMAMEGGDGAEMTQATKQILSSCITEDIDIEKLATFDIEYLFLQLRSKSVGEVIELRVGHTGEGVECDHKTDVEINIDDIVVEGIKVDKKIMVTDTIGIIAHYPTMQDVDGLDTSDVNTPFKLIVSCIDMVFDGDNVYEDFTADEMRDWLDGLNQEQFKKISDFFAEMPKLSHTVSWKCPKCGALDTFTIEGLSSFFTLL